jgi:thiol-disulfide isomerase/thioredoxin
VRYPGWRLACLVLGGCLAVSSAAFAGRPAPPLTGTDPVTGKHVSLAQFKGKPVVINVWASWCGGCAVEAPDLKRFASAHPQAQLLGIDYQDAKADAKAWYRRFDQDWPSIWDPTGKIAARLGLGSAHGGFPTTFFLNRRHEIVALVAGAGTLSQFERAYRKAQRST